MRESAILVFDIETYPDRDLVAITQGMDLEAFREQLRKRTGSDFLPPLFHVPISIAYLETDYEYSGISVRVQTATPENERSLLEFFWARVSETVGEHQRASSRGLLVSFNGSEFDVPVLELRSLKHAVRGDVRLRDPRHHFDVLSFLTDKERSRKRGLNLSTAAKAVGLPGKAMFDGSQVQAAFESGELSEIGAYCLLDVLQTYFLFLRCKLLAGMEINQYQSAVRSFSSFLSTTEDPHVRKILPNLEAFLSGLRGFPAFA